MNNILIACDHKDPDLGQYLNNILLGLWETCDFLRSNFNSRIVDTDTYKRFSIESIIDQFNSNPFVTIVLAHGNEDAVYIENQEIVHLSNSNLFVGGFFYAISCLTADGLGHKLISEGCRSFIGYNDVLYIVIPCQEIFSACQTKGLEEFLNNNRSSGECYQGMINKYNLEIDALYLTDAFAASFLVANRDSLEIIGSKDVMLSDLSF